MRAILARPLAYRAFGAVIGAARARTILVREHVRPTPGQRVLDIGCGPGELVPFLQGLEYVGLDQSAEYIAAARQHYPEARFVCERIGDHVVRGETFDLALAIGVLHHLDDDDALTLLRVARASLRRGGRLVTLDGCHVPGQHRVSRWLLSHDRGRHVRARDEYARLMRQVFADVRDVVRDDLLRVPYTHLVAECRRS
jgi:SAM-dependent methyltransferase